MIQNYLVEDDPIFQDSNVGLQDLEKIKKQTINKVNTMINDYRISDGVDRLADVIQGSEIMPPCKETFEAL